MDKTEDAGTFSSHKYSKDMHMGRKMFKKETLISLSVNTMYCAYNRFCLITVTVNCYSLLLFTLWHASAENQK